MRPVFVGLDHSHDEQKDLPWASRAQCLAMVSKSYPAVPQVPPAIFGGGGVASHDRADDRRGAELAAQVPVVWLHPQGLSSRQGGDHARGTGASLI